MRPVAPTSICARKRGDQPRLIGMIFGCSDTLAGRRPAGPIPDGRQRAGRAVVGRGVRADRATDGHARSILCERFEAITPRLVLANVLSDEFELSRGAGLADIVPSRAHAHWWCSNTGRPTGNNIPGEGHDRRCASGVTGSEGWCRRQPRHRTDGELAHHGFASFAATVTRIRARSGGVDDRALRRRARPGRRPPSLRVGDRAGGATRGPATGRSPST